MQINDEVVQRIRYYVEVVRLAANCMQASTLNCTRDPTNEEKRTQASDCAHSDHGIIDLRLDCILNALDVEPWPSIPDGTRLVSPSWEGGLDL